MFPNLEAEMARSKITQLQMAEMLQVTPTTLSFKLNGKSSRLVPELCGQDCLKLKMKSKQGVITIMPLSGMETLS